MKKGYIEKRTCSILSELIIPKSTERLPILIGFYVVARGVELELYGSQYVVGSQR